MNYEEDLTFDEAFEDAMYEESFIDEMEFEPGIDKEERKRLKWLLYQYTKRSRVPRLYKDHPMLLNWVGAGNSPFSNPRKLVCEWSGEELDFWAGEVEWLKLQAQQSVETLLELEQFYAVEAILRKAVSDLVIELIDGSIREKTGLLQKKRKF